MSSDPAVNAADKVCERFVDPRDRIVALAAAREALAPLRDLHRKRRAGGETYCAECCQLVPVMGGHDLIYQSWPCATAKLIYPKGKLT